MKQTVCKQLAVLLLIMGSAVSVWAETQIMSLTPVSSFNCVAFELELPSGQGLSGLRWHHNDSTVQFPRLLLMEASGFEPDLSQTGLILEDLGGEELGWGEANFTEPVASTTGNIFAVLVFPDQLATTGPGDGGGPGLGVVRGGSGPRILVSTDGSQWLPYAPEYRLVVEPILTGANKREPRVLAELAQELGFNPNSADPKEDTAAQDVLRNLLYAAAPNPFNPRTEIRYDLRDSQHVQLAIFDVRGRRVTTIVQERQNQGVYRQVWEGTDDSGVPVASGVYFVRLMLPAEQQQRRLTLLR